MEESCREAGTIQFHGVLAARPTVVLRMGMRSETPGSPSMARRVKSALGRWPPSKTVNSVGNNFGGNTDMIKAGGEREFDGVISMTKVPTADRDTLTRGSAR